MTNNWIQDRLMGSLLWPIAALLLTSAVTLPCLGLVFDERPKGILNAFASLFNTLLAVYLGIIPVVRDQNKSAAFIAIFILALSTAFAAAVSAVVLAFFDGYSQVAATNLIRLLLGPFQNYIFVTVLGSTAPTTPATPTIPMIPVTPTTPTTSTTPKTATTASNATTMEG